MEQKKIGMIGLGVMGKSLAINLMRHGFQAVGYNRRQALTEAIQAAYPQTFTACASYQALAEALPAPRVILLMVPAGQPVDDVLTELQQFLQAGDILIDGGNSFFKDTERRQQALQETGIQLFGAGVSGGEQGALNGPSIMPGGPAEAYERIRPFLTAIAAKKDGQPCCAYIGPGGSGHYVKMVHNGIEYADMQLLAETDLILRESGCTNAAIADLMDAWNKTEAESYLVGITADVLREKDDQSANDLVDMIRDAAGNKGTGKWTSIEALKQEYNASLLSAAFQARIMSNQQPLRQQYRNILVPADETKTLEPETIRKAYYLAKVIAYAQGFGLYADASQQYSWHLNLASIAAIFRAGCIIQARLLQDIMDAYQQKPDMENLLMVDHFRQVLNDSLPDLQKTVLWTLARGIPAPVFTNAYLYVSQLSADRLGANLIQAQRDYFGAHTYQRIDGEEFVHHQWGKQK